MVSSDEGEFAMTNHLHPRTLALPACLGFLLMMMWNPTSAAPSQFVCGDVDGSGNVDISDVTSLVSHLFDNEPLTNFRAADCDSDGLIDMADITYVVDYVFLYGPAPSCSEYRHRDSSGGCLSIPTSANTLRPGAAMATRQSACLSDSVLFGSFGTMHAELIAGVLHVYHVGAYYQCCLGYSVMYQRDGDHITAMESDTNPQCDCYCYFDLESTWPLNDPYGNGDWIITLIGIAGDTVGVDTIPRIGTMEIEVTGHDLHISHHNAVMNCCPMYYVEYTVTENTITAIENDSLYGCHCLCLFDLESTLYGLSPGEYTVRLIGGQMTPFEGDTVGVATAKVGP
jgi:hypothetical protein